MRETQRSLLPNHILDDPNETQKERYIERTRREPSG